MRTEFEGESYAVADASAAAEQLRLLLGEGDTVLVKGSRAVGLERVAQLLGADAPTGASADSPVAGPADAPAKAQAVAPADARAGGSGRR
jgi:hypothetical protein